MKKFTTIKVKNKEIWYRIYGSRAGQTLEISNPQNENKDYTCLRIPYNDILRGENESMEDYVKKEINNYDFKLN